MDHYIYKPPPPPPSSKKKSPNDVNQIKNPGNPQTKNAAKRQFDDMDDDEESKIVPQITVDASDVAKWIEERRKNWPSAKRVAEKKQEMQRLKRLRQEHEQLKSNESSVSSESQSHGRNQPQTQNQKNQNPRVCKFFLKGKCQYGKSCKNSHTRPQPSSSSSSNQNNNRPNPAAAYKRYGPNTEDSLFKRLVQNDIDKENEKVLDFIAYIHSQGHL